MNKECVLLARRCMCLLLAMLLLLGMMGCAPTDPNTDDSTDNGGEENENEEGNMERLDVILNGASAYTVVRPELGGNALTMAAVDLRRALEEHTKSELTIASDYVDRGTEPPTDTPEILVGLTNRQESVDVYATLKENEFTIRLVGKRLVVLGYDDMRTLKAVDALIAMLPELVVGNNFSLRKDFCHNDSYEVKVWLDEFDKTSLSYYKDDKLTFDEETLLWMDGSSDDCDFRQHGLMESPAGPAISFKTSHENAHWTLINTPTDSFFLNVDDKFTQTIKMWVYVNDADLMVCDHDAVYDTPQVGSQTLYITLSEEKDGVGHTWQHTFYGSGWHEIELSFTCHNVAYPNLEKINYDNLTSLKIWCNAKAGLEVAFADMRLCTYENEGYVQPEAPHGGRWLSTCDYEALDGPILTEWYGCYFDLEEKLQGSSSIAITGHKENVDHRVCIGIDDVDVVYDEDTICFDMFISDLTLLGTDWQIRLEHNAQAAHYTVNYSMISAAVVDENMMPSRLKNGWNHIQLPLNKTGVRIGAGYEDTFTNDLTLTQLVFYIAGTGSSEEQNYLIRYDNMYVAKTADLQAAKAK